MTTDQANKTKPDLTLAGRIKDHLATLGKFFVLGDLEVVFQKRRNVIHYALHRLTEQGHVKQTDKKVGAERVWQNLVHKTTPAIPKQSDGGEVTVAAVVDADQFQLTFTPTEAEEDFKLTLTPTPETLSPWDKIQKHLIDHSQMLESNPGKNFDITRVGDYVHSVRYAPGKAP